ncbi:MAG: Flp pilus assembly protein CpaB [Gemmataceae bacterium]
MRPKTLVLLFFAIGCGLIAFVLTNQYLSARPAPAPQEERVPVLIARQVVPAYSPLKDPQMFEVVMIRKSEVRSKLIGDFESVKGRVLKYPLGVGKPLAEEDLAPPGQEAITWKLKPGERAMTVKVTPVTGTAGFILPGDRVDVVATQIRRGEHDEPFSQIILQDVEVLAIDQQVQTPDGKVAQPADHVTLRLTPEQVELLSIYADTGTLRLVPRRPDDKQVVKTSGASPGKRGRSEAGPRTRAEPPVEVPTPAKPVVPAATEAPAPKPHVLTIIDAEGVRRLKFDSDR